MKLKIVILLATVLAGLSLGAISAPNQRHQEITTFLERLYSLRTEPLVTGAPTGDLQSLYVGGANGALAHEQGRITYMQDWARARDLKIIAARPYVTNVKIKGQGDWAEVSVIVRVALDYQYNGRTEINTMGVGSWHGLVLSRKSGSWKVEREYYLDALGSEVEHPYTPKPGTSAISTTGPPTAPVSAARQKAAAYAEKFCGSAWGCGNNHDYNKTFHSYRHMGGDCANFGSQVLTLGGGLRPDWTWRADGKPKRGSAAWVNAQSFTHHLIYGGKGSLLARGTYPRVQKALTKLAPGDIIAYQSRKGGITHVSVVTGWDSAGVPVVAAHTADRFRNPWDVGWDDSTVFWLVKVHLP